MIQMGVHDSRQPSAASRQVDMTSRAIRAWAREQGLPVSPFGQIPAMIRALYVEAMGVER